MPNVMAAMWNIGGALCSTPQSLADAHYYRVSCSNAAKTRNALNLHGCPKLSNRSQPLVGRSSSYYEDVCRRYCCLTSFFRLSIHALVAKKQPDKFLRWCPNGEFLVSFCFLLFQRAACSAFQTCILNSHYGTTSLCRSMVDIHSATAEIRRGIKKKKKKQDKNIMS